MFPMYLQNASRDKRFEALIVRVPWPEWLAELERDALRQREVRAGHVRRPHGGLRLRVRGALPGDRRRSPAAGRSTTSAASSATARRRASARVVAAAARPAAARTCRPTRPRCSPRSELSRDAYMLWDLIHDRAHSHGDLPFDPFMIRQRMPYWMYSLEELRCDLTAFAEAVELEREGFAFARHVQYAILFDRLFRFPITGTRVRNYDGLGGQLLFAYLHQHGFVHWTDNRLTIEWERVADGVIGAARGGRGALPRRASTAPRWRTGSPRTSSCRTYVPADGRLAAGRAGQRAAGRRERPEGVARPGPGRRVPAVDLLHLAAGEAAAAPERRVSRATVDGKVVAIAGAAGGSGPSCRSLLAQRGATLALAERNAEMAQTCSRDLSLGADRCDAHAVDLLDADAARALGRATSRDASAASTRSCTSSAAGAAASRSPRRRVEDDEFLHGLLVRTVQTRHARVPARARRARAGAS